VLTFFLLSLMLHAEVPQISAIGTTLAGIVDARSIDVDGDGDLDLISQGGTYGELNIAVRWAENIGNGRFQRPRVIYYRHQSEVILNFANVQGDGWIEMLTIKYDEQNGSSFCMQEAMRDTGYVGYKILQASISSEWMPLLVKGQVTSLILESAENGSLAFHRVVDGVLVPAFPDLQPMRNPLGAVHRVMDIDFDGTDEIFLSQGGHLSIQLVAESGELTQLTSSLGSEKFTYSNLVIGTDRSSPSVYVYQDGFLLRASPYLTNDERYFEWSIPTLLREQYPRLIGVVGTGSKRKALFATYEWGGNNNRAFLHEFALDGSQTMKKIEIGVYTNNKILVDDWNGDGDYDVLLDGLSSRFFWGSSRGPVLASGAGANDLAWGYGVMLQQRFFGEIPTLHHGVGDFDNDGDLDIVTGWDRQQRFLLMRNDGKGNFSDAEALPSLIPSSLQRLGCKIFDAHFADFDQDGITDFLVGVEVTNRMGRPLSTHVIARNSGNAKFQLSLSRRISLGRHGVNQVREFADWDDDGDLDVFYANHWRMNQKGFLENLERPFVNPIFARDALGSSTSLLSALRFGDLNGDGLTDCLANFGEYVPPVESESRSNGSTKMRLYYGNSGRDLRKPLSSFATLPINQLFKDALGNPTTKFPPSLFDADLDGDLDLLALTSDESDESDELGNPSLYTKILLNPGSENQDITSWPTMRLNTVDAMRGFKSDYDGDGVVDLCSANSFIRPTHTGPVVSDGYRFSGEIGTNDDFIVAIADFDGDQDADILYRDPSNQSLFLVRNTLREHRNN
jgi:FG-GAP-like repeat